MVPVCLSLIYSLFSTTVISDHTLDLFYFYCWVVFVVVVDVMLWFCGLLCHSIAVTTFLFCCRCFNIFFRFHVLISCCNFNGVFFRMLFLFTLVFMPWCVVVVVVISHLLLISMYVNPIVLIVILFKCLCILLLFWCCCIRPWSYDSLHRRNKFRASFPIVPWGDL